MKNYNEYLKIKSLEKIEVKEKNPWIKKKPNERGMER